MLKEIEIMRFAGIVSGVAGALALTGLHQVFKNISVSAPRVDILGMRTIVKILKRFGFSIPKAKKLYLTSLAGDILFNSIYYSLTSTGKRPLLSGSALGIGAGAGVVNLPGRLGLGKGFSASSGKQKLMSYAIYLTGGIVSAISYKLLKNI